MASKKKMLESARTRIREKLGEIRTQRDSIVSHVNDAVAVVEEEAQGLLDMKHSSSFMKRFSPLMQDLEKCHNKLFLLLESLQDGDESDDDSDSNSSVGSLETTQTGFTSITQVTSVSKSQGARAKFSSAKSAIAKESRCSSQDTLVENPTEKFDGVATGRVSDAPPNTQTDNCASVDASINTSSASSPSVQDNVHSPPSLNNLNVTSVTDQPISIDPNMPLATGVRDDDVMKASSDVQHMPPLQVSAVDAAASMPSAANPPQASLPDEDLARAQLAKTLNITGNTGMVSSPQFEELLRQMLAMCTRPVDASVTPQEGAAPNVMSSTGVMTPGQVAMHNTPHSEKTSSSPSSTPAPAAVITPSQLAAMQQRRATHRGSTSSLASSTSSGRAPTLTVMPELELAQSHSVDVGIKDYGNGPPISVLELTHGSTVEGLVIEITNPWLFWFQPKNSELTSLQSKMQAFNACLRSDEWGYKLPCEPEIGMVVCAKFGSDWYRACIINVSLGMENDRPKYLLRVFYLDFGNQETVTMKEVRPLAAVFAKLPCQVIACTLDKVGPLRGDEWPSDVPKMFATMICDKAVEATLYKVPDCPLVFTELLALDDSNTKDHHSVRFNIAESLIQTKTAKSVTREYIKSGFEKLLAKERKQEQKVKEQYPSFKIMSISNLIIVAQPTFKFLPKTSPGARTTGSASPTGPPKKPSTSAYQNVRKPPEPTATRHQEKEAGDEKQSEGPSTRQRQHQQQTSVSPFTTITPHKETSSNCEAGFQPKKNVVKSTSEAQGHNDTRRPSGSSRSNSTVSSGSRDPVSGRLKQGAGDSIEECDRSSSPTADVKYAQTHAKLYKRYNQQFRTSKSPESTSLHNKSWPLNPSTDSTGQPTANGSNQQNPAEEASVTGSESRQRRLKERGLPVKLPAGCEFRGEFEDWMQLDTGDNCGADRHRTECVQEGDSGGKIEPLDGNREGFGQDGAYNDRVVSPVDGTDRDAHKGGEALLMQPGNTDERFGGIDGESVDVLDHLCNRASPQSVNVSDTPGSDLGGNMSVSPANDNDLIEMVSLDGKPSRCEVAKSTVVMTGLCKEISDTHYDKLNVVVPADGYVHFLMSHMDSPSQFYVHLVQEGSGDIVNDLMTRLNKHFSVPAKNIVWQKFFTPSENDMCVARYSEDEKLYRGQIITCGKDGDGGEDQFEVFYVDFGNREWTNRELIYPLPPEFLNLPPQAVPCTIAEIEPVGGGEEREWSSDARATFSEITGYEKILLGFVGAEHAGHTLSISLADPRLALHIYDTSGDEDVWINQVMVAEGYATAMSGLGVTESELESTSAFHLQTLIDTVHISNLPQDVTLEDLAVHFKSAGHLKMDEQTDEYEIEIGEPAGEALIRYVEPEAAELAINMFTNKDFRGRPLRLELACREVPAGDGGDGPRAGHDGRQVWMCPIPGCGWSNLHWRTVCHLCNTSRPEGLGTGEDVSPDREADSLGQGQESEQRTASGDQTEAEACDSQSGAPHERPEDDTLQQWDPMKEDHESIRNSYLVDTDDPGVATVGYKAQDERRICNFYRRGLSCWRGSFCKFEHVRDPGNVVTTDKVEVVSVSEREHLIPLPEINSWVAVEISAIYNPSHFYVVFPFGTRPIRQLMTEDLNECVEKDEETLQELISRMNAHYTSMHRDLDLTVPALGEILAVKFVEDNNWYRGKCIESDPDNERMKVFYVDFGNVEWVHERLLRKMELQFMHLPFQCVESFLSINPPLDAENGEWTDEAKDFFADLVDDRVLYAQISDVGAGNTLTMKLYDTSEEEEVCINDLMVSKNYASYPVNQRNRGGSQSSRSVSCSSSPGDSRTSSTEPVIVFRPG